MYNLFEQKYKEVEKSLFLVAIGYLHNTEDAKDCVQEAVLSAWKSFDRLRNIEYFKTWITRIVINTSKNYLKKRRYTEEFNDNIDTLQYVTEEDINQHEIITLSNKQDIIH